MKIVLGGEESFIAEVPEDITLKQLIEQCDKIIPRYFAYGVGITSLKANGFSENIDTEIIIDYDSVRPANKDVDCIIKG